MALPDTDAARSPELLFGDIVAYIDQAEAKIEARDTVALVGLNDEVDALCKSVLALERENAKEYTPELEYLHQRLEQLKARMAAFQKEIVVSLNALNASKRANSAYIKQQPED